MFYNEVEKCLLSALPLFSTALWKELKGRRTWESRLEVQKEYAKDKRGTKTSQEKSSRPRVATYFMESLLSLSF